jgi:RNA polymerase sigma-70 factor (ECF subfamily)
MARRSDHAPLREEALEECLKKLAGNDRLLIEHRYYHQQTPKDTALQLSRSVHSIYRSLARIHTQLRDCVERTLRKEFAP